MSNTNMPQPPEGVATALVVCKDAAAIAQLGEAMQQLALTQELCGEIPAALVLLNRRKFDAVVVDLQLQGSVNTVLGRVRQSPSNRTAVLFAITDSDAETISAFRAGSNFVLKRPLSLSSISRTLKVAYGLILRERRRYFRCPVKIPVTICRAGLPNIQGQTLNISENGMAISTSTALRPGVEVQLQFNLPSHDSRFAVGAVISWCKEARIGLQFSAVSAHLTSELQEWLLHQLEDSLPEPLADRFRSIAYIPHAREAPLR
jgi:DNA-binding response OmpR family regulator